MVGFVARPISFCITEFGLFLRLLRWFLGGGESFPHAWRRIMHLSEHGPPNVLSEKMPCPLRSMLLDISFS